MKAGSRLIVLLLPFWFVCDAGSCAGGSADRRCAVLDLVHSTGAVLVDPVGIHPVDPALVQVDEEHHIWSGGESKKKKVSDGHRLTHQRLLPAETHHL